MRRNFFLLIFFFLLLFILKTFVVQFYIVTGTSMLPTLRHGSIVLVYKLFFSQTIFHKRLKAPYQPQIQKNDIALFDTKKSETLIKRVVGVPGDTFVEKDKGAYPLGFINSKKRWNKKKIPQEYYMLLGDNVETSYDSRHIGLIHLSRFRGKLLWILKK